MSEITVEEIKEYVSRRANEDGMRHQDLLENTVDGLGEVVLHKMPFVEKKELLYWAAALDRKEDIRRGTIVPTNTCQHCDADLYMNTDGLCKECSFMEEGVDAFSDKMKEFSL